MPVHAANNRYTGNLLYISFGAVVISTDYKSLGVSESMDTVDVTAGSSIDRTHIPTLRAVEFSLDAFQVIGLNGTALRAKFATGVQGELIYGPEGTAAGKPKYACLVTVISSDVTYPFDGDISLSATLMRNGAWTANFDHSASVFP